MAGRIRDDDITLVRDRSALLDVLGEYGVVVKRAGTSYKALCPFHDEKSPSLSLRPTTGVWHCFGCGEGGDVIDFVQKIDNLDFLEAVERLAERGSIELRREDTGPTTRPEPSGPRRSRILEVNKLAEQWFANRLATDPEAGPARDFLGQRAFTREHADQFSLGYAPRGWDNLSLYLISQNVTTEDMIGAGLSSLSKRGTPVDRFRGRLIWPIRDVTGATIGFGARKLYDDDDSPKYLNTPETNAYHKSQVLYGLDLARKDIAAGGHAVIVEGYTDVMAAHVSGVTTAVATCGTAFGEEHTRILRRVLSDSLTTETTFLFDGDSAGQKAALRAYELDARFQSSTTVSIVPDGLDPCELRLRDGETALRDLIVTRTPLFEFVIKTAITGQDLTHPSGRTTAMALAAPVLARIKDDFLREQHVITLAARLGVADKSLRDAVALAARTSTPPARRNAPAAPSGPTPPPPATPNTPVTSPAAAGTDDAPPPDPERELEPDESTPTSPQPLAAGVQQAGGAVPDYPHPDPLDANLDLERHTSKLALQQPQLLHPHLGAMTGAEFSHPAYRDIIRLARLALTQSVSDEHWIAFIRDRAVNPTTASLIIELSLEPAQRYCEPRFAGKPDAEWVKFVILRLQLLRVGRTYAAIQTELRQADPADDLARVDLAGRARAAANERRSLQTRLAAITDWAGA